MPMPKALNGKKNTVGLKFRQLRESRGWSQRNLAHEFQKLGYRYDQNFVSRIERGERHVNEIELRAIMHVFQIPSAELFENNDVDI